MLIDLDKTAIGARFRLDAFRQIYDELHQPPYHPFTADNQDILVYISLMVSAGVYAAAALLADLKTKRLATFEEFVARCDERLRAGDSTALYPIHEEVINNMQRGDPRPFKGFRYREYERTVARMDALPDDTPREQLLAGGDHHHARGRRRGAGAARAGRPDVRPLRQTGRGVAAPA